MTDSGMAAFVGFLLAQIAEDKTEALAAQHVDGPETLQWRPGGSRRLWFDNGRSETYASVFAGDWDRILVARDDVHGGPVASHIARWDPARVLAECEAKRRRVKALNDRAPHPNAVPLLRKLLALEALPYVGHPDFRAEWRP